MPKHLTPAAYKFTVAAVDTDAALKARANYICTGVGDLAIIQQALDALPDNAAVSGEVILLAGNYTDATDTTVSIGSQSAFLTAPRKVLRAQRGARLNISGKTGRKAVIKIEAPDCQVIDLNISGNTAFGAGTGIAVGGDIATFGGRWDKVVNRATIRDAIISNMETAIEFTSIDGGPGVGGSVGDCNVHGGYLFQNKTAIRAAGYTNSIYGPTLANNNKAIWVEARRAEAQLRSFATTIVGWNEVGILIEGGYGSTFHDTWMEHTSSSGSTATEAIRFGSATAKAAFTRFTGTTTIQLVNEAYAVKYLGALNTLIEDLVVSTSGAVPATSIARNELSSTSKGNRIQRTTFGPNAIPSHTPLSIDAAAWGDVWMDQIPGLVGQPAFSTRLNTSARGSSQPAVRKAADTSKASDAAVATDSDFTMQLAPTTNYALTGLLLFDASAAGDLKVALTTSAANGSVRWAGPNGITATSGASLTFDGVAAGTVVAVPVTGIVTTSDLTTLTLGWAQATSDATATIVKAGSWLRLVPIP